MRDILDFKMVVKLFENAIAGCPPVFPPFHDDWLENGTKWINWLFVVVSTAQRHSCGGSIELVL